jgi:hypothetical protein
MVVGDTVGVSELYATSIFSVEVTLTMKMEAAYTSKLLATLPTTTLCNNPRIN